MSNETSLSAPMLAPCPFCDGNDVDLQPIYDDHGKAIEDAFGVTCYTCQFLFSVGLATAEEITEDWNKRPD